MIKAERKNGNISCEVVGMPHEIMTELELLIRNIYEQFDDVGKKVLISEWENSLRPDIDMTESLIKRSEKILKTKGLDNDTKEIVEMIQKYLKMEDKKEDVDDEYKEILSTLKKWEEN